MRPSAAATLSIFDVGCNDRVAAIDAFSIDMGIFLGDVGLDHWAYETARSTSRGCRKPARSNYRTEIRIWMR